MIVSFEISYLAATTSSQANRVLKHSNLTSCVRRSQEICLIQGISPRRTKLQAQSRFIVISDTGISAATFNHNQISEEGLSHLDKGSDYQTSAT